MSKKQKKMKILNNQKRAVGAQPCRSPEMPACSVPRSAPAACALSPAARRSTCKPKKPIIGILFEWF